MRWRSYGSEYRKEELKGGGGELIIITHMYLVARVWSVPGFRPYCKPGLHSDHVTVNVGHVAVKMHPSQHMLVIIRS